MSFGTIVIVIACFIAATVIKLILELSEDKHENNNSKSNNKKKDKIDFRSITDKIPHSILVTSFEILIVFFSAFLAIQFTAQFEKEKNEDIALIKLKYVGEDCKTQAILLKSLVELYKKGDITYEFLTINASFDTSLIEELLFRDEIIRLVPEYAYEVLMTDYRQINDYLRALELDINKSSENHLQIYQQMYSSANGYIYCTNQLIHLRKTHDISEAEFHKRINNYVEICSQDANYIWEDLGQN